MSSTTCDSSETIFISSLIFISAGASEIGPMRGDIFIVDYTLLFVVLHCVLVPPSSCPVFLLIKVCT